MSASTAIRLPNEPDAKASTPSCAPDSGPQLAAAPVHERAGDDWFRLSSLRHAYKDRFQAARDAQRIKAEAPHLVRKAPGGRDLWIHASAVLGNGLSARAVHLGCTARPCGGGVPLPPNWDERGELVKEYDDLCKLPKPRSEILTIARTQFAERLARLNLKCHAKSIDRLIERIRERTDGRRAKSVLPLDGRGRPAKSMDDEAWAHFCSAYGKEPEPSVAMIHELVAELAHSRGWKWPSLRTVQARVQRDLSPAIRDLPRKRERRWDNLHGPFIERDLSGMLVNQVWVGDHNRHDVWARDGDDTIRCWLTVFSDQRTRAIRGWVLVRNANADSILAALRAGILAHGVPERVYTDNGRDFRARAVTGGKRWAAELDDLRVESAAGRLGIAVTFAKAFRARSKSVERIFGTLGRFWRLLPSYTGNRPETRPENVLRNIRDGKIVPPTIDELRAMIADAIATYNATPHGAPDMEGLSPDEATERFEKIACRTAPREVLERLCDKLVRSKVGRNGVRVRGVPYHNIEALTRLQGRDVLVRYTPGRGDEVEVLDERGKFLCVAQNFRLRGVDPEDIAEGERRRKQVRALAKKALPALRDSLLDTPAHALRIARERAERLARERRKAVGAPDPETVDRRVELLADAAREHENARLRVEARRAPEALPLVPWDLLADLPEPAAEPAPSRYEVKAWDVPTDADAGDESPLLRIGRGVAADAEPSREDVRRELRERFGAPVLPSADGDGGGAA